MGELGEISNHQVKVDNWPIFFLQRLHHFYKKKSHCDLTLLFSTDTVKSIKVHKLVLHACTDYFESLDITKDSEHGEVLKLSNEMHPDVVIPIISFMYTGKLEFPVTLQPKLYEVARKLRMTILTKLLDVQPSCNNKPVDSVKVSIVHSDVQVLAPNFDNSHDMDEIVPSSSKSPEEPVVTITAIPSTTPQKIIHRPKVIVQSSTNSQIKTKVLKKNIGLKVTAVSSKPKVVDGLPPTLPGRKLPVWKRKVPFTGSQQTDGAKRNVIRTESPKPTRFEWDDDLNDPTSLRPVEEAPKNLSHDGITTVLHPIILGDEPPSQQKDMSEDSLRSSDDNSAESPPFKRSKSDLQDMKEYGKQQQLRNEIICSEENSEDLGDTDDLYGPCDDESDELPNFQQCSVSCSTPKPILKTVSKPEPPVASKRVRFSLEGKENNQQQNEVAEDFTTVKQTEPVETKRKIVVPVDVSEIQSGKHHVKIVSEVLKKYPNLAKRRNIKLKVMSKTPAAVPPTVQKVVEPDTTGANKAASSLVSYIFLTNKSCGDLMAIQNEPPKKKVFDPENLCGPWFCDVCDETKPIQFDSYYTYRKHFVEVHYFKIDSRICEFCGMRNSKRNYFLHHRYTIHGIEPPPNVVFPKCPECDYIALSETLLQKHKATHDPKELLCYTCNVKAPWQAHMQSECHKNKLNEVPMVLSDYPCPFCEARFENANELRDHMETSHQSQVFDLFPVVIGQLHAKIPSSSYPSTGLKQRYRCPYCETLFESGEVLGKHIVSLHWGKYGKSSEKGGIDERYQTQSGQQLEYAQESSKKSEIAENQPSSELESLGNVASGIATSLSLVGNEQTVIYYEQKAEDHDAAGEETTVVSSECQDYIIADLGEDSSQSQDPNEGPAKDECTNSKLPSMEEVTATSCSDHDYSEPQIDENLRQVIPLHTISNQMSDGSVIQQILPEQRLVFANQGNVVFQSQCVNLPQGVLLTSGKMVLPSGSGEENVILSQVIPQTQIILSNPILQQSDNVMEDGTGTIVFTDQEEPPMENIQSVTYAEEGEEKEEESEKTSEEKVDEPSEVSKSVMKEKVEKEIEVREPKLGSRFETTKIVDDWNETTKIVDDWDETNEREENVKNRTEGPRRPELF